VSWQELAIWILSGAVFLALGTTRALERWARMMATVAGFAVISAAVAYFLLARSW
jgi:hypothetical protein